MKIESDGYQKEVIESAAKDILVLAGAGSGKTFTLLSRIHSLITYKNIDPECVLVLTFTRVAAENMRNRYMGQVQDSNYDAVPNFNTFHGFCYQTLSSYTKVMEALGYSSVPSVVDEIDMEHYIAQAMDISSCKLSRDKVTKHDNLTMKEMLQYENYHRALKKLMKKDNVIDFDTLSSSICNLFKKDDDSVKELKEQYKYVFVDEFQDTDKTQFDFIMSLKDSRRVLCGDALQNIYQFRGCTNKPMKRLIASDSWVKYKLPINYRSSTQICEYVNDLSSGFVGKEYRIELRSNDFSGPEVEDINCSDMDVDLVSNVGIFGAKGKLFGSTAILCRTNLEVGHISNILRSLNIEVTNNKDSDYLTNLIMSVKDSEHKRNWLSSLLSDKEYIAYKESGFKEELLRCKDTEQVVQDIENIESILNNEDLFIDTKTFQLCEAFNVTMPSPGVVTCNEELIANILNKVQNIKKQDIYVGTIHSSKGLEYDNVIVYGVNSKYFKLDSEEDENIFYVACTRAKNNLVVLREGN